MRRRRLADLFLSAPVASAGSGGADDGDVSDV
jgi:hypothetical protein